MPRRRRRERLHGPREHQRRRARRDAEAGEPRPQGQGGSDARRALVARYKTAVEAWHEIGAWVDCGYIIGFEADRPGCGEQGAVDALEIGIDLVHFYHVAPLPGAEDYARAKARDLLLEPDFNEYFKNRPMVKHPVMSADDLADELAVAVKRFYSWRHVLKRVVGGVLGIGRARVAAPWTYAKRQIGQKMMIVAGLFTYYEGGLLRRRGKRWDVPREVVWDEEARRHYLGATPPIPTALPPILAEDGTMEALPILRRHRLHVGPGALAGTSSPTPGIEVASG